jgi:hypothetical protein
MTLFEPGNHQLLAAQMLKMKNPVFAADCAKNVREAAVRCFSVQAMVKKTQEAYQELTGIK